MPAATSVRSATRITADRARGLACSSATPALTRASARKRSGRGGDGAFFDRFVKAVSVGKSLDATVDSSETLKTLAKDYLSGDKSLPEDLKEVLLHTSLGSGDIANLSLSALLTKLLQGKDPAKLDAMLAKARELGIGDHATGRSLTN